MNWNVYYKQKICVNDAKRVLVHFKQRKTEPCLSGPSVT